MISNQQKQQITQTLSKKTETNDWVITGPEIEARECTLYKAFSLLHPHNIAIKVYREIKNSNTLLQYDALKFFSESLNLIDNEFFVPKVFGSFPESGMFLMEWVESPTLERRLWRYFYSKKHVQNDINRTFKWLNAFHQQATPETKPVEIDFFKNTLNKSIKNQNSETFYSHNKTFIKGKKCLLDLIECYRDFVTLHANLHGDFTPSNVLIDDNKVTGIDFFAQHHLPVDNDIALQLSYITIEYPNMLTRSDFKLPPNEWPILKVVLDAYEYPEGSQQLKFFLVVFLYQLLRRWTVIKHRQQTTKTPLMDRWRLLNTEMIVGNLSQALEELHQ